MVLGICNFRFHTTYPDSPYGSFDAFDLAYGFSVATELGTGDAGLLKINFPKLLKCIKNLTKINYLGTGDGGKDFLPRRFLMFEQELLWSLKQQSNEIIRKKAKEKNFINIKFDSTNLEELELELELELDFDEADGDSFNGFLTVYEKMILKGCFI